MRTVKIDEYVLIIPETNMEIFKYWLLSFFVGEWVSNFSSPCGRSLVLTGGSDTLVAHIKTVKEDSYREGLKDSYEYNKERK